MQGEFAGKRRDRDMVGKGMQHSRQGTTRVCLVNHGQSKFSFNKALNAEMGYPNAGPFAMG